MVQVKEKEVTSLNDVLFKKVFATQGNSHIIMGFLKDIAGIDAESVKVIAPYNVDTYSNNTEENGLNYTEVDLAATLPDRRQITIELQVAPQGHFNRRLFYYTAERYRSMYGKNDEAKSRSRQTKYDSLEPIHSITILKFMMFDDVFTVDDFVLRSRRGQRKFLDENGAEILIITFFELGKKADTASNVRHWIDFFLNGTVGPVAPDYIKDACEQVRRQNLTRRELRLVNTAEKAHETQKWLLLNSEKRGMKLGLEQGLEQGKLQTVREFKQIGVSIEQIMKATGLTRDVIEKLE